MVAEEVLVGVGGKFRAEAGGHKFAAETGIAIAFFEDFKFTAEQLAILRTAELIQVYIGLVAAPSQMLPRFAAPGTWSGGLPFDQVTTANSSENARTNQRDAAGLQPSRHSAN